MKFTVSDVFYIVSANLILFRIHHQQIANSIHSQASSQMKNLTKFASLNEDIEVEIN